ncbi:DUF2333 family protein [Telmatospirillum siberiense]|uniref:DUF2333 domain-containing protein n=1 Tax=Telmatospirillum siberiense TaxID=382514 RepID=A0A2N3PSC7_9PROT|nr:DUF2333 family protein [Telmatospirillum siberiense]PKU23313.1 DUF2333 domain-containing protein [Telmatospirillum siberiense]
MTVLPGEEQAKAPEAKDRSFAAALFRGWSKRRLLALCGIGVLLAFLLYYPVGAWRVHAIDDDPGFAAGETVTGQSKAVAIAARLIRREVDQHGWTPNKPFFLPVSILVDMPNFQKGITAMVGRFAIEMDQQIGRSGASADADLERAAGLLQYPPNVWMIDPAAPWARTLSTEKQYRNAARSFEAYNQRLAAGQAAFDRRPEVLREVLVRFAKELEATAGRLDAPIGAASGWFSRAAGEAYYGGKGRAYAALLLLGSLGEDDAELLTARGLTDAWRAMLASLAAAATPRPWLVLDGAADSTFVPNHLTAQGYHLLRATARLNELAEALR